MYDPGTILVLKEKRSRRGEPPFPYDRVRVIGRSPQVGVVRAGGYSGNEAERIVIQPLEGFAATIDEPRGKLMALYNVESIPEIVVDARDYVKVITPGNAGPSPEEVFAEAAKKSGAKKQPRKPPAPALPDPEIQDNSSPI